MHLNICTVKIKRLKANIPFSNCWVRVTCRHFSLSFLFSLAFLYLQRIILVKQLIKILLIITILAQIYFKSINSVSCRLKICGRKSYSIQAETCIITGMRAEVRPSCKL